MSLTTRAQSTVIIVRVPSIKIPVLFAQRRPGRDRHRIKNNHPYILGHSAFETVVFLIHAYSTHKDIFYS